MLALFYETKASLKLLVHVPGNTAEFTAISNTTCWESWSRVVQQRRRDDSVCATDTQEMKWLSTFELHEPGQINIIRVQSAAPRCPATSIGTLFQQKYWVANWKRLSMKRLWTTLRIHVMQRKKKQHWQKPHCNLSASVFPRKRGHDGWENQNL